MDPRKFKTNQKKMVTSTDKDSKSCNRKKAKSSNVNERKDKNFIQCFVCANLNLEIKELVQKQDINIDITNKINKNLKDLFNTRKMYKRDDYILCSILPDIQV